MLRWLTAGESHGEALVGIVEGVPAGVELTTGMVQDALARRRLGYGRGARMKFEQDRVRVLGGVRHGVTQGGPVAIEIANTEWPKWQDVMSSDPVDPQVLEGRTVAYLDVDLATVRPRIRGGASRPLLQPDPETRWSQIMAERRETFERLATITLDARAPRSASQIAHDLHTALGAAARSEPGKDHTA